MLEEEEVVDYEDDEAEYEFTQEELDQNMDRSDPVIDAAYADVLEEPMPQAPSMEVDERVEPNTAEAATPTQANFDSTAAEPPSHAAEPASSAEANVESVPERSALMDRLSGPLPDGDTSSEVPEQDADYYAAKRSRHNDQQLAPGWRIIYPDSPYGEVSYYNEETMQTVYFKPVAHRYLDGEVATEVVQRPSKGHMKRAREAQRRALIAQAKAESASPLFNRETSNSNQREPETPSRQSVRGTAQSPSEPAGSQSEPIDMPLSPDSNRKRTAAAALGNGFSRCPVLFLGNDVDDVQPIIVKDEEGGSHTDRPSPLASRTSNGASDASGTSIPRSAFPPAKQVPVRAFSSSGSPLDYSSPPDAPAANVFTFRVDHRDEP